MGSYLPAVTTAARSEPVLMVKQGDDGATFLICAHPQPALVEAYGGDCRAEVPDRPIDPSDPPSAAEITEAMWGGGDCNV